MRKFTALGAVVAVVMTTALVSTAGARDIPVTLNLIAHETSGHVNQAHTRFIVTGSLLKAGDRDHRKGHFRAVFNRNNRGRAVAYLRNGKIKFDGRGNNLVIIGGTRHWEGVTGTLHAHDLNKHDTLLTIHVE